MEIEENKQSVHIRPTSNDLRVSPRLAPQASNHSFALEGSYAAIATHTFGMTFRFLSLVTLVAISMHGQAATAASESSATLDHVVQLVTSPTTMTDDRERTLKSVAFHGGTPHATVDNSHAVYAFEDGNETHAQVVLNRVAQGWQLQSLTLLFDGTVDEVKLSDLRTAFTRAFGAPKDATLGQGSNTVLIWRGSDRVVRVTADVAETPAALIYIVAVSRP